MDQVKIYLALLVKYHFWVLSVLVLIIGFSGWIVATKRLDAYYTDQLNKINAQFTKMQAITRKDNHPNKSFEEGVDKLLNSPDNGLKVSVLKAWSTVYDEQKNQVLKWPEELGEDFLKHVQDKGPENEIAVSFRERYQNYVKAEFPRLVKIIKAEPHAGTPAEAPDAADPAASDKPKEEYIVNWRADNQHEIDDALDWPRPPTTKELLYVQENLWVYHALLDIIARVNETATGHYNAKIKDVNVLAIARHAAQEFQSATAPGKIYLPAAQQGSPPPGPPSLNSLGTKGQGTSAALAAVQDEGRYVDAKGQPLAAGAAAPPEFKRMPIYLQVVMDQREISLLLAECANSPLPVEVHQVRVNPASLRRENKSVSPSVFGGSKRGAGGGGGRGMDLSGNSDLDLSAYDMPVEVFGIIYIYNRPNRAKLDVIGQAAASPPPATGAEPPAAGAPAPERAPDEKPAADQPAGAKEPDAEGAKPAAAMPEPAAGAVNPPALDAPAPAKPEPAGAAPN